ncbi:ATP synthase F0 subcomplex A subunit [Chryseobacterium sp. RU37D]|uniref:F0F1 ATP synthase subunit A n=1 Tax=Chryseobacterium sp. RU37D TaxID=1907397 RepID=UPI0009570DCA|nr:F0F1 ATP synthase subunit A [Chryseobacterium sp. RU37D]SIQ33998.1 ATP synthase F0 subcomplex A subunit [Chryseobacterium sp. RU37D]
MFKKFAVLFYSIFVLNLVSAQHGEAGSATTELSEKDKVSKENKEFIDHHLLDAHDFTLMVDKEGHHIGFPLPVIFYDNGIHAFMSSKEGFMHGEPTEVDGNFYKLHHEKIYKTDAKGTLAEDKEGHVTSEKILDLSITKSVLIILLTSIFMFVLFTGMARSYKKSQVPTGAARFLEPLVIFVRDEIAIPNIGHKYKRFIGYLLTVFFFILFLNVLGLMPFGINVTGNITMTFFLAILTYLITTFSANKDYWLHIFWMPGVPVPMKLIMLPIELLGTITKPFALMIRLFANMTAGHIVVMSLIGLIYVFKNFVAGVAFPFLTLVIYLLEVLVAFLQAYIFTMLSALFIGMAVQEHEHEHHAAH